ncbi:HupE/UreJ family protein [Methylomonas koyamae]|uniref:HupE/UreJ family protein n=1 Tax=Methylomonas koyamae TaxID=702114 RepID=UPI001127973B|nr:HupE/UreJ family protein [Methylomonas koyamae]TPQ29876.1 hypothetical protein C2U68_00055 [Methylomonas koyamae]
MRDTFHSSSPVIPAADSRRLWVLVALMAVAGWFLLTNVQRDGLSSGFAHPFAGNDHLVTMLAVGIWAAQLRGHAIWMLPATFVGVMSLGGLAGALGCYLPQIETIVLLSCAVFGILIVRNLRFSTNTNLAIVALFGFCHGFAHGQEISASAGLISYVCGFVSATLLLHGAGIVFTKGVVLAVGCFFSMTLAQQPAIGAVKVNIPDALLAVSKRMQTEAVERVQARFRQTAPADAGCFPPQIESAPPAAVAYRFRRLFPEINHSPGLSMTSNGVGRTSPPPLPVITVSLASSAILLAPQPSTALAPAPSPAFSLPGFQCVCTSFSAAAQRQLPAISPMLPAASGYFPDFIQQSRLAYP